MPSPEQCGKLWLRIRRNWQLYALLFLPLLWLVIFRYAPMYGAQIAFREYSPAFGIEGSPWVGLAHFERFFKSYYFKPVIVNTLVISFYSLLAGFPIPIILALSVNQVKMRLFRNSVQMITYAPHFISTVVIVGMLFQFLHPRVGFTASLANMLGLAPPNWMGDPAAFRHIFVWSGVWQEMGFGAIIYLAVLLLLTQSNRVAINFDHYRSYLSEKTACRTSQLRLCCCYQQFSSPLSKSKPSSNLLGQEISVSWTIRFIGTKSPAPAAIAFAGWVGMIGSRQKRRITAFL
ncbi:MAG: hypothetical protein OXN88_07895 [Chloroflexota bacterium]|nr:hypothetical protein [Chloroflexota bacterium]